LSSIGVSPSGEALGSELSVPSFESWHPSQLRQDFPLKIINRISILMGTSIYINKRKRPTKPS
jgi:hypothetical protein